MNLQENINRIKQVMGLLNEQASGALVGDNVYDAIKNIEHAFGFINDKKEIEPRKDLNGRENSDLIKNVINNSIGLDYWAKLDPKLQGQIYSFMFQSDSGVRKNGKIVKETRFRWLAGLAQAIDSSINRTDIIDKQLNDPNVQNAIKIVKNNIDKIDYNTYMTILKSQYEKLTTDDPKNDGIRLLYIWEPRPYALDKLINGGESWESVEKWWWNRIDPNGKIKNNPYKNVSNNNTQVSSQSVVQKIINSIPLTNEELIINDDLYLRHSAITSLPEGLKVGGDLSLSYSKVKSLPEGLEVGGDLYLMNCNDLTSLPKGLKVSGGLFLNRSKSITSLPEGLEVGDLSLRETNINSLPKGLKVNELLYIEYCPLANLTDEALRKMVEPNGNILNISRGESSAETTASTDPANTTQPSDGTTASTDPANTTQPSAGASTTPPATTKPYPDMSTPFTPTNGDPWQYAYDGTNLIVKKKGSSNTYNLMDPDYAAKYRGNKLADDTKRKKAIDAIKNAYGTKLGMS
jgi:hypothetical protein